MVNKTKRTATINDMEDSGSRGQIPELENLVCLLRDSVPKPNLWEVTEDEVTEDAELEHLLRLRDRSRHAKDFLMSSITSLGRLMAHCQDASDPPTQDTFVGIGFLINNLGGLMEICNELEDDACFRVGKRTGRRGRSEASTN